MARTIPQEMQDHNTEVARKANAGEYRCVGCEDKPVRAEGPLLTWLEAELGRRAYCMGCALEFLIDQYVRGRELTPDEL